jgi:hypothetical protein
MMMMMMMMMMVSLLTTTMTMNACIFVEYNYSHVPAVGIDWGCIVLTYHSPLCTSGQPGDGTN